MAIFEQRQKNGFAASARILFGEPEGSLRQALRTALSREGFEGIVDFDRTKSLREAVLKAQPDLLILDSEMDSGAADAMIQEIRHGKLGENPFVPVIVTIWEPTQSVVRRVASSGTDDIMVKPLSPGQILERIRVLVRARKPFVVTSDYIGPDRRKDESRPSDIPRIDVPNTLRAKIRGEQIDRAELARAIEEAQRSINDQKLKRNAFQIAFLVEIVLPEFRKSGISATLLNGLERLTEVGRDTAERVKDTKWTHVSDLCTSLIRVTASIRETVEQPEKKEVDLLKPLSEAIVVALHPDESSAAISNEIANAVAGYKKRGGDL
ncbi:response regulator transcription factor [Marivibrio halodurans]|uniref:Response regulator transcription factor n=1 Tax=Marivibrio halodurans TaxID=2039722 RepID=A0A8J7V2E2_9PROT|nr:response regulator [Marivibrio halodurans]MBP5857081.1 response regulator transcription factor [Marivibrio halodurans]